MKSMKSKMNFLTFFLLILSNLNAQENDSLFIYFKWASAVVIGSDAVKIREFTVSNYYNYTLVATADLDGVTKDNKNKLQAKIRAQEVINISSRNIPSFTKLVNNPRKRGVTIYRHLKLGPKLSAEVTFYSNFSERKVKVSISTISSVAFEQWTVEGSNNGATSGNNRDKELELSVLDTLMAGTTWPLPAPNTYTASFFVKDDSLDEYESYEVTFDVHPGIAKYIKGEPRKKNGTQIVQKVVEKKTFWSNIRFGTFAGGSSWRGNPGSTVTTPTFGIFLAKSHYLFVKLGGGYRWFSSDDVFGNRTETQILAEIDYYPFKKIPLIGFAFGIDSRWESVESPNEFLINSWGLPIGLKFRSNRLDIEKSGFFLDGGIFYNPSRINEFGHSPSMNWKGLSGTINLNYKF